MSPQHTYTCNFNVKRMKKCRTVLRRGAVQRAPHKNKIKNKINKKRPLCRFLFRPPQN
jgi:hypothetical protein